MDVCEYSMLLLTHFKVFQELTGKMHLQTLHIFYINGSQVVGVRVGGKKDTEVA